MTHPSTQKKPPTMSVQELMTHEQFVERCGSSAHHIVKRHCIHVLTQLYNSLYKIPPDPIMDKEGAAALRTDVQNLYALIRLCSRVSRFSQETLPCELANCAIELDYLVHSISDKFSALPIVAQVSKTWSMLANMASNHLWETRPGKDIQTVFNVMSDPSSILESIVSGWIKVNVRNQSLMSYTLRDMKAKLMTIFVKLEMTRYTHARTFPSSCLVYNRMYNRVLNECLMPATRQAMDGWANAERPSVDNFIEAYTTITTIPDLIRRARNIVVRRYKEERRQLEEGVHDDVVAEEIDAMAEAIQSVTDIVVDWGQLSALVIERIPEHFTHVQNEVDATVRVIRAGIRWDKWGGLTAGVEMGGYITDVFNANVVIDRYRTSSIITKVYVEHVAFMVGQERGAPVGVVDTQERILYIVKDLVVLLQQHQKADVMLDLEMCHQSPVLVDSAYILLNDAVKSMMRWYAKRCGREVQEHLLNFHTINWSSVSQCPPFVTRIDVLCREWGTRLSTLVSYSHYFLFCEVLICEIAGYLRNCIFKYKYTKERITKVRCIVRVIVANNVELCNLHSNAGQTTKAQAVNFIDKTYRVLGNVCLVLLAQHEQQMSAARMLFPQYTPSQIEFILRLYKPKATERLVGRVRDLFHTVKPPKPKPTS